MWATQSAWISLSNIGEATARYSSIQEYKRLGWLRVGPGLSAGVVMKVVL